MLPCVRTIALNEVAAIFLRAYNTDCTIRWSSNCVFLPHVVPLSAHSLPPQRRRIIVRYKSPRMGVGWDGFKVLIPREFLPSAETDGGSRYVPGSSEAEALKE